MISKQRIQEIADGLLLHADAGLLALAEAIEQEALERAVDALPIIMEHESYKVAVRAIRALIDAQSGEEKQP
jgi:hypothetical protein